MIRGENYSFVSQKDIIHALSCHFPFIFGVAEIEPYKEYIPPETIWDRVKQLFRGPNYIERAGEIEIAILHSVPDRVSIDEINEYLDEIIPYNIIAHALLFRGVPQ